MSNLSATHFLVELRSRLLRSFVMLFLVLIVATYFANTLYHFLAFPLLKFLPQGHLIATQLASSFFVPFKLAFMVSLLLAVPFFLFQLWSFISPALYGYERRLVWPFLWLSVMLFYAGIAFSYFVILPTLFHFLAQTVPSGVVLAPDISEYFDFTIKLLLVFGFLFEIPMVMVLLISVNIVSRDWFIRKRSYAIIGAFILGMLLAPPDVLSQTLLAVPICLLYELGILLGRFCRKDLSA
ncbi:MAG TPA: twin-arginine translocase subunit TatC [Gammaproteobacteria bacterium]|nr:twin-arginine translocase subunit TatC [Gammaproteobacteria bacterium]